MQHLEEGTVHAWLDGAITGDEAAEIERHVATCAECAAMVAEARGFIAASSRILTALDDVPSHVIPTSAVTAEPSSSHRATNRAGGRSRVAPRRTWWRHPGIAAAAAVTFLAVGTWTVVSRGGLKNSQGGFADNASGPPAAPAVAAPTEALIDSAGATRAKAPEPRPETKTTVGDAKKRLATDLEAAPPPAPRPERAKEEDRRVAGATTAQSAELGAGAASASQTRDSLSRQRLSQVAAAPATEPPNAVNSAKTAADRVPINTAAAGRSAERANAFGAREDSDDSRVTSLSGCYALHFVAGGDGPMTIAPVRVPAHIALDAARIAGSVERVARDVSPANEQVSGEYRWRATGTQTFELIVIRDGESVTFPARLGAEDALSGQGPARPMPAGSPVRLQATREPCR